MGHSTSSCVTLQSFDQTYTRYIKPKLESIDLFIKSTEAPYLVADVASLLSIESAELLNIMNENNIVELNRLTFFNVIFCSSSDICKLIAKQWRYQNHKIYTPQMISDIYEINVHKVTNAFEELNISSITDTELMDLFKRIHTTIYS